MGRAGKERWDRQKKQSEGSRRNLCRYPHKTDFNCRLHIGCKDLSPVKQQVLYIQRVITVTFERFSSSKSKNSCASHRVCSFFFQHPKTNSDSHLKSTEGSYREKLIVEIGHYGKAVLCWCVLKTNKELDFPKVSEPYLFYRGAYAREKFSGACHYNQNINRTNNQKRKILTVAYQHFLIVFSIDVDAVDSHELISYLYPLAEPSRAVTHDVFNCAEITANHNLKACCCFVFTLF